MKYSIFHHILESNIQLPELVENRTTSPTIFFQSTTIPHPPEAAIEWCHHWRLKNGQISISVGRENDFYWLRFPQLADFSLSPEEMRITCYRSAHIPDDSIRHLLLDQVIPRLLSHRGQLIIHASCIQIGDSGIAFCGESGWGKSTLAAFLYSQGYPLLTDDCLLLEGKGSDIVATPGYHGVRLFEDSLALLPEHRDRATAVCHYGSKKRVALPPPKAIQSLALSTIYILNNPAKLQSTTISTEKVSRAAGVIELIKHCFPLDITDIERSGDQLRKLSMLVQSKKTQFRQISYPRQRESLGQVAEAIIDVAGAEPGTTSQ